MLVSHLKRITESVITYNSKKILKREIKDYERQSFYNRYSAQVKHIEAEAKQKLETLINTYLETLK